MSDSANDILTFLFYNVAECEVSGYSIAEEELNQLGYFLDSLPDEDDLRGIERMWDVIDNHGSRLSTNHGDEMPTGSRVFIILYNRYILDA
jgi:PAS domain-containing protein